MIFALKSPGAALYTEHDIALRKALQDMADQRARLLSEATLCEPALKVLRSMDRHWAGLLVFVDHPLVPMDNDIAIEDFRRENHTLLNRGEPAYQLQRAVDSGKEAPDRGRRRDEMKAMSGSQALLTNMVLAWNTRRMHEVIERLKRDGMRIEDDWLRRIGPAHFSDINFLGAMRFGGEICRGFGTARAAPSWHVWLRDKANRIRPRTDVDNSCQTTRVDAMSRQTMSFALPESVRE